MILKSIYKLVVILNYKPFSYSILIRCKLRWLRLKTRFNAILLHKQFLCLHRMLPQWHRSSLWCVICFEKATHWAHKIAALFPHLGLILTKLFFQFMEIENIIRSLMLHFAVIGWIVIWSTWWSIMRNQRVCGTIITPFEPWLRDVTLALA